MKTRLSGGIFGGTILGIWLWLWLTGIGGNNGCWPLIEGLTGLPGYEGCGLFGMIVGIGFGSLAGIVGASFIPAARAKMMSRLFLLGAVVLPFLYALYLFRPWFEDAGLMIVPPVIIFFMTLSALASGAWLLIQKIAAKIEKGVRSGYEHQEKKE